MSGSQSSRTNQTHREPQNPTALPQTHKKTHVSPRPHLCGASVQHQRHACATQTAPLLQKQNACAADSRNVACVAEVLCPCSRNSAYEAETKYSYSRSAVHSACAAQAAAEWLRSSASPKHARAAILSALWLGAARVASRAPKTLACSKYCCFERLVTLLRQTPVLSSTKRAHLPNTRKRLNAECNVPLAERRFFVQLLRTASLSVSVAQKHAQAL